RPEAARFEAHPGEDERGGDHHPSEGDQRKPLRSTAVVVREQDQRVVVDGPGGTADQGRVGKAGRLGQLRYQETTPADLLAEREDHAEEETERRERDQDSGD